MRPHEVRTQHFVLPLRIYNRITLSKIASHWCFPLMKKLTSAGEPYYISKRTLYCQKAMRQIITTLQIQQFIGTIEEGWPETQAKSSLKWSNLRLESHCSNNKQWSHVFCLSIESQVMPRDEMEQSSAARNIICMEVEDTWGLPEV